MLFSYNWLKEYIGNLPPPKELADRLTMSGTEVESVTATGTRIKGVVTAEILTVGKHPNADKLQLCEVRTDAEKYQIVCGARNMKAGDRVALALAGAELPNGIRIKISKIRGVESQGMMCSETELGLKETSEGIMILPPDTALGMDINVILGLSDFMMEAGVTPNRADLLSVKGLAREIAAVTGAEFRDKAFPIEETGGPIENYIAVKIVAEGVCRRYSARVIEGVTVGPSPDFIKRRVEAHGIRSINNIVDITNYVLLELGQPMHAFDLDRINGRVISVRHAKGGEKIKTLDDKTRTLDPSMLVIADSVEPVALAGVMGGLGTEVTDSTRTILLESAWFDPGIVRRASRKAGLSTDSSYRFERGVDIEGVTRSLDMAASLINEYAGGRTAKGIIDVYPDRLGIKPIEFRIKRSADLLGMTLCEKDITDIFGRLGIGLGASREGVLLATPPSYRMDLKNETDLIEELARIYGYEKTPTVPPVAELRPSNPAKYSVLKRKTKDILTRAGLLEVVNYSFVSREMHGISGPGDKNGIALLNPLTEEQSVMRVSLMPSLLENLRSNLSKKNDEVKIFEVAPVYIQRGDKLPAEDWKVSGLIYGARWAELWNCPKDWIDFYDVKGVVEKLLEGLEVAGVVEFGALTRNAMFHPGKSAHVSIDGNTAGILGEVHQDICAKFDIKRPAYLFELDMETVRLASGGFRQHRPLPKFPESARDIAFIVDENIQYQEIINSIKQLDAKFIETFKLFDVYCGGNIPVGKRSIALRITYRAPDRTMTGQEVDGIHSKVSSLLIRKFNAQIRGPS